MLGCSSLPCGWLLRNETEFEQSALAIIIPLPSLLQGDGHLREILGGDKFNLLPITILPRHLLQKCDNKAGWWRRLNQKWVVDGVPAYQGKEFADRAMHAVQCEGFCWRDFRQFASSSSVRHWHLMISLESQSSCNIWFLYAPGLIIYMIILPMSVTGWLTHDRLKLERFDPADFFPLRGGTRPQFQKAFLGRMTLR